MKKICIVTSTRAEYSLLYHTIKAIEDSSKLELQLIVTGTHLSESHGYTVNQIKEDGFNIDSEIDMLINSNKKTSIAKNMSLLIIQLSNTFESLKPDMILILGDRYEILAVASTAMSMNIPIAHIHGGESTEGLIDEQIRHAITKMSHLHFTTTEIYKSNVIKMGEQNFRVFNVGAPVVENIRKFRFKSKKELEKILDMKFLKFICVVTYHPVTLMDQNINNQIDNLLNALSCLTDTTIILTSANADFKGEQINKILKLYASKNEHCIFVNSLGNLYLNVLKYADVMVGNSSSGLIEAPCFKLPVVNIGERQKGRLRHDNIIDVDYNEESIRKGIHKALYDYEFKVKIKNMETLYGEGYTSSKITEVLKTIEINQEFILKKLNY